MKRVTMLAVILVAAAAMVPSAFASTSRMTVHHIQSFSTAQAIVTGCSGVALLSPIVQAGNCSTDQPITGMPSWSSDYTSVADGANAQTHTFAAASYWGSNGTVDVGTGGGQLCVTVNVSQIKFTGRGAYARQDLVLSYNFAQQAPLTFMAAKGSSHYCGLVPVGASNVFASLITVVGAPQPASRATLVQTFGSITYTP